MGLDVSIERIPDYTHVKKVEELYRKENEELHKAPRFKKPYGEWSEDDKNEFRLLDNKLLEKYRLGKFGEHQAREKLELDSKIHGEHLFKIGYFRSSYNGGGINNVLRSAIGKDLYYIFDRENGAEYEFQPNWKQAKERALQVLEEYKDFLGTNGFLHVAAYDAVGYNQPRPTSKQKLIAYNKENKQDQVQFLPTSDQDAMEIFKHEKQRNDSKPKNENSGFDFSAYSNRNGSFYFGEPVKVRGFIPGLDILGRPCVYVISDEQSDDDKDQVNFYVQSLEIVVETIDYILNQEKPEEFFMQWSA